MPYDVGDALSRIEQILLNSMQRNLHRHLHEEQDEGLQWTMWQTEQLTALRTWSARNLKAHTPAFTKINDAAIRLLEDSGKQAELAEERQLLADGIQQAGSFFHASEDKVQALLTSVRHDLSKAEYSILRQADDVYRKAIFDAQVYLQTGSGTLENAIDMAVQDLQKNGIQSVVYRNGRRVEASAYARMALRSANVRARLAGEGKARDKYGIHTVIAPPSGIACEKCVKWLCRVLVDDVYCSGTPAEADELGVPLLSQAIAQGFLHPQCNCSLHTYHTGSPVLEMSQEERDEAVRKYRLTQKQRYNERQIRKWKRAEKSAPDETARKAAAARRREWQNVNRQLCDEHHDFLRRDYSREKIYDAPECVIVPDVIEKFTSSEIEYMSSSFRPVYSSESEIDLNTIRIPVKKVENSEFTLWADVNATKRNKAVRLTEKQLKIIRSILPVDFELPPVAVVDFDSHGLNPNAIGGFHAQTGMLFLNSRYDTAEKIVKFVTRGKGDFANQTEYAPFLHELGHKFYEDSVKRLAKSKQIGYNEAKNILNAKIYDYIHANHLGDLIETRLSSYAQSGYDRNKYSEIIAECFSVYDKNELAKALIDLVKE